MPRVVRVSLFIVMTTAVARADDWPEWRGPRRDGVWREKGIVEKLPGSLSYRWRRKVGAGYAGPAVAQGRVYVADRVLEEGVKNPDDPFARTAVKGKERLLCLKEESGDILWTHEYPCQYSISYPSGPRATPTVRDGRVYHLGAMGNLFCLDAATGKVLWSKDYRKDYGTEMNVWGMSAAPLVDGEKVVLLAGGLGGAGVIALDRKDGKEIWRALDLKDPGYCPPSIIEEGGARQLIIWTPYHLNSLDPETGKIYWQEPFKLNSNLSIPTPVHDREKGLLLVTSFYNGSTMMRLDRAKPEAKRIWRGKSESEKETDGLHAILCTPIVRDGYIYGVCSYGQLRCLEAETGKRVWETLEATGSGRWWNAFIVPHEDRYFIANEQGDLIIAHLSPQGYKEVSRARLIAPTTGPVQRREKVVWSHPAFANRCVYARNDEEIVCADLAMRSP